MQQYPRMSQVHNRHSGCLLMLFLLCLLCVASTAFADITSNLQLWWRCDENTGTTVADSTGNGHTGTLTNGATWTSSGRMGAACNFDGVNDYVTGSAVSLTTAVTAAAWINPTTFTDGTAQQVFETSSDSVTIRIATSSTDRVSGFILNASSVYVEAFSTTALAAGVWSHVALTYDGSVVRMYVNGTEVSTSGVAQTGNVKSSATMQIGIHANLTSNPFGGAIDEFRVYTRALTSADITELANSTQDIHRVLVVQ